MAKGKNKYRLVYTGGDVIFVGKRGSRNFIERETGFHGDWAECMDACSIAGFEIGKQTDKDFVAANFDNLKSVATFHG